jgi:putative ABC transport system permease protein
MRISSVQTLPDLRRAIVSQMNVLVVFLLIMAVLLAVVGGLGLAGTMSINVLERTREIGVLRAVGAGDRAVIVIVLVEGILIGALSWILGTLLGYPFGAALSTAVGQTMFLAPLTFKFSTGGAVLWLGLVLLLAAGASILPAWNASRLTVRDVLAYE